MSSSIAELEHELAGFPTSVGDEFRRATQKLQQELRDADLMDWAQQGIDIARHTVRSWEAASEYFRVSPGSGGSTLVRRASGLGTVWEYSVSGVAGPGHSLLPCQPRQHPLSSPQPHSRLGKAGPDALPGTWKSTTLAAKFFESSGTLLAHMGYQQLEQFAELVNTISHKSADLAAECLSLGQEILPNIGEDQAAFIRLSHAVAEANWREVKPCFESAPKALAHIAMEQRSRFLGLAVLLAQAGMSNIPLFLTESATSLGTVEEASQGQLLDLAGALLPTSHEAVAAFLQSSPALLGRVTHQQLASWFETGMGILQENRDGGLAYFRVESSTSEDILETLSSAVELDRFKEILRMYCQPWPEPT